MGLPEAFVWRPIGAAYARSDLERFRHARGIGGKRPDRKDQEMTLDTIDPEVMTVEEAAKILRIGRNAAYALAKRYVATDGREGLPVLVLGRTLRVPASALKAMVQLPLPNSPASRFSGAGKAQGPGRL